MSGILSFLTIAPKNDPDQRRVDARLECGFCSSTIEVSWYPGDAVQDRDDQLRRHFDTCEYVLAAEVAEITVYDGTEMARIAIDL